MVPKYQITEQRRSVPAVSDPLGVDLVPETEVYAITLRN